MKWETDTLETKVDKLRSWHYHFCWKPLKYRPDSSKTYKWVWMERVLRRGLDYKTNSNKIIWVRWEYKDNEFDLLKEIK